MSRTPMFLDLSAKPGPGGVKTADDIIAENERLRDLVRRMIPRVEASLAVSNAEGEALDRWLALLREAREAVGESMKEGVAECKDL